MFLECEIYTDNLPCQLKKQLKYTITVHKNGKIIDLLWKQVLPSLFDNSTAVKRSTTCEDESCFRCTDHHSTRPKEQQYKMTESIWRFKIVNIIL